jgi:hypothetical protein
VDIPGSIRLLLDIRKPGVFSMEDQTPLSIVTEFIECVNQGDIEKINAHLSPEVIFPDIQGRVYIEHEFMENYLKAFPNYKIHVQNIL